MKVDQRSPGAGSYWEGNGKLLLNKFGVPVWVMKMF